MKLKAREEIQKAISHFRKNSRSSSSVIQLNLNINMKGTGVLHIKWMSAECLVISIAR